MVSKAQQLKKAREKNEIEYKSHEFVNGDFKQSIEEYYNSILTDSEIDSCINEYKVTVDNILEEFKIKTKLQDNDIAFLSIATLLQCTRIYLINYITKIQTAGSGNKLEKKLHDVQKNVLGKFSYEDGIGAKKYYAPLEQIIIRPGVPYDATAYDGENFGLFRGANHRFATLGHDPVLGLVFGTANILTNTITCFNSPILSTHHVKYTSSFTRPKISEVGSTLEMFSAIIKRFEEDKSALVAAVIKQLIHIATDLYTPCGIQLPGLELVLSKKNVEELTKYISTGDIVKAGASAGLSILINYIISAIHGCMILEKGEGDLSKELYSVRTRKIILYSNLMATSSNIIYSSLTGNIKSFDLGGFMVTAYRLFSDPKFIKDLKYEFLNSQLSKIYEDKIQDDLKYFHT